jgi:tRNA(Ile)-lysidine synthase
LEVLSIIESLRRTVEKYSMISRGDGVLIALSGGADSVCLFHGLICLKEEWSLRLEAVHVNHCMRAEESDADEAFVKGLCEEHGLKCASYRMNVPEIAKRRGKGLEEAGRDVRYECFYMAAEAMKADKIALAHNRNDNAETVIMRICRGTGLKGLCGIPPVRGRLIRPLIEMDRKEIEMYLKSTGNAWREDSTNAGDMYARNRVRHIVIPAMEAALGANVPLALARASALASVENDYLEQEAEKAFKECLKPHPSAVVLCASKLSRHHPAIRSRVVRIALSEWSLKDLAREHILQAEALIFSKAGKAAELPGGLLASRGYDEIIFTGAKEQKGGFLHYLNVGDSICVPEINLIFSLNELPEEEKEGCAHVCTKAFLYDKLKGGVEIRSRRPGDRIRIRHIGGVKLKDYFINSKIPRSERDLIALAAIGSEIAWIMDKKGICHEEYEAFEDDRRLFIHVWEKSG